MSEQTCLPLPRGGEGRGEGLRLCLLILLAACTPGAKTGAVDIKFDRDQCTGCGMVISEPHFAAEVRGGPKGAVTKFDDVGCAVKWLNQQPWADDPATEVWVARQSDGQWIDAKTAKYAGGKSSPMGFGFSAGSEGLTFEALRAHVRTLDTKH